MTVLFLNTGLLNQGYFISFSFLEEKKIPVSVFVFVLDFSETSI